MKTLKRPLVLVSTLIAVTLLLSWRYFDYDNQSVSQASGSSTTQLSDAELEAFMAESGADAPQSSVLPPAAEDVLVQRIPGDDSHLRLMAFYSKENYSKPSVTIENGYTIELRDDGKGEDKIAGDGLYTTIIPVDVAAFRKQVITMAQQMRKSGYKPMRYIHRELVLDPDMTDGFSAENFDANAPVSISGITNALSTDLIPDATFSSLSSGGGATALAQTPTARSSATAATSDATATNLDLIKQNSILITNLAVVEDPTRTWNSCKQTGNVNGPWTFGTLMRQLASKDPAHIATDAQVSTFVKNWLNTRAVRQVINGDTVEARAQAKSKILTPWLNKSQNAGAPAGQLDMKFAPFKLTAIVNRFDLRDGQRFGVPGSPCGEGRFVFCLIDQNCTKSLAMTIIFEFGINQPNTCEAKKAWAQQWVNLKSLTLGSSQYNQALQNITDQFSLCGSNPSKPNQSSLDQLRTNEIALSPTPRVWELREFIVNGTTGNLAETTVGQSPADRYNAKVVNADVQRMVNYVTTNRAAIKAGQYTVPLTWQGFPFLGAKSHISGAPTGNPPNIFHWDGTDASNSSTFIADNDARNTFSLETCAGCHAGEAQTGFTHVDAVFYGTEAGLSGFVAGKAGKGGAVDFDNDPNNAIMTVEDAALRPSATSPKLRTFNEIDRRGKDLRSFAGTTCGSVLGISSALLFQPVNMVD